MSGHLLDLFGLAHAISAFLLGIVKAIFYGLGGLIPPAVGPLQGVGDFFVSEWLVTLVAWLLAITVMLLWATMINLLTMMWIERKFYSRLQDRVGIKIGLPSMDFLARIPPMSVYLLLDDQPAMRMARGAMPKAARMKRMPKGFGFGMIVKPSLNGIAAKIRSVEEAMITGAA